jgi:hypothetical protein
MEAMTAGGSEEREAGRRVRPATILVIALVAIAAAVALTAT